MRNKIVQLIIAAILAVPAFVAEAAIQLPQTGQTTCFDTNGDPRACAGTGEDGEKLAGVAWPSPRFTDNGDGTVADNLTGLIWSLHANAPDLALVSPCAGAENDMTWQEALNFITCLNETGYLTFSDWRLPNLNELESMVHAGVADSSVFLNASGFGNADPNKEVQSSTYWTSTSDVGDSLSAWDVSLNTGDFPFSSVKNDAVNTRGVWPVRGTSTAPAQLWRTGQAQCFNAGGVEIPSCVGTGQDGEKLAGAAWPVPRFQSNVAVTFAVDRLTGFTWPIDTQTPGPAACANSGSVSITWQEALDHVQCLNTNAFLGITDWRLPNRKELRSLVDYSAGAPALPAGNPFVNEPGNTFWSSTTNFALPDRAWTINMFDGSLNGAGKDLPLQVWPVSGPDAAAPAVTVNAIASPTRVTTQTVSGTVEAGIVPVVTVNTAATAGAVEVAGANWSCVISGLTAGVNDITVTATDPAGNANAATTSLTIILSDGSFSGTGTVTAADALKALRIAVGLVTPTAEDTLRGDCAPLGAPDGSIDVNDALLILQKAVGLVNF
jgi:hypothetical protein